MSNMERTIEAGAVNPPTQKNVSAIYTLLLIMLLALTIRLIGWNLIDSLYRDTVNFIVLAEKFSAESFSDTVQEPLHPLILRGIHTILFPRDVSGPIINQPAWELTVFALGIFFTLICIWLLYAIGRHLHSPAAGLWAAFFLAIMPYGVEYSVNGLSELPFLALILLSIYLVMKSGMKNGWLILLAGLSAALIVLTRKEGFILIPIILLYLLCRRQIGFPRKLKLSALFLAGAAAVFLAYYLIGGRFYWIEQYIEVLRKLTNRRFGTQACMGDPNYILALHWIDKKYEYLTMPIAGWFKLSGFVPAILFLVYLVKRRSLKVSPGVGLLIAFAIFHTLMVLAQNIVTKAFVTRYLFPACVVLFPIAGLMLAEIIIKINLKYGKPAEHRRAGLITAFILLAALTTETIQNCYTSRHPEILAAARWLDQNTHEDVFLFASDDRVGLYCHRPWENAKLHYLASEIQTLPDAKDGVYLAIDHKKHEKGYVQSRLNLLRDQNDILAEPVRDFARKNNVITIYRLSNKE
jgi:hypothetical protein